MEELVKTVEFRYNGKTDWIMGGGETQDEIFLDARRRALKIHSYNFAFGATCIIIDW